MQNKPLTDIKRSALVCLLLAAATAVVYLQTVGFEFVNLDDNEYVYENPTVKLGLSAEGLHWAFFSFHSSNWHPLTWLSHMLDVSLFGLDAGMHHLTNLVFHITNTLLLFGVLYRITAGFWQSAMVAALFALHPLHVESVAWVSERKDVLSAFFWLLAVGAYARYVRSPGPGRYILVVLLFAAGLTAKPMVVTLPFVLLLMDVWPLGRIAFPDSLGDIRSWWPYVKEKTPLFVLSASSSVVTSLAQQSAMSPLEVTSIGYRIGNAILSYGMYLWKMIAPVDLAVLYPVAPLNGWQVAVAAIVVGAVSIWALKWRHRHPWFLVGWLWYLGTLVPVIGLVAVGRQSMADRYTYLPLIGVFIMICWGASLLTSARPRLRKPAAASAVLVLAVFSALTWKQLGHWQGSIKLFSHTIQAGYPSALIHNNLGNRLRVQERRKKAVDHFKAAIGFEPAWVLPRHNLALTLIEEGGPVEAIGVLEEVRNLDLESPETFFLLGRAHSLAGNQWQAAEFYQQTLEQQPGHLQAIINLGVVSERLGRIEDAERQYVAALQIAPNIPAAHHYLGLLRDRQGQSAEAIDHLRQAASASPEDADIINHLGVALAKSGRIRKAIARFEEALEKDSAHRGARENLEQARAIFADIDRRIRQIERQPAGAVGIEDKVALARLYMEKGAFSRAETVFSEVLKKRAGYVLALQGLAMSYAAQKKEAEALEALLELADRLPGDPTIAYNIACAYARQHKTDQAVLWLDRAFESGYNRWHRLSVDPDLDPIRSSEAFRQWIEAHRPDPDK